jgi:GTP-binding protein
MKRLFHYWGPWKGEIAGRGSGALVPNDVGEMVAYATVERAGHKNGATMS